MLPVTLYSANYDRITPTVLQRELDAAHAREEAAREREAVLLQMLQQLQQQNQRLLDMPRTAPPSRPYPGPHLAQPLEDPRGEIRRRIVALLQEHPEGLTPTEMRILLSVERSLSDTCLAMLRYGLAQRMERGRYVTEE
jgi:hypothetical protein